MTREDIINKLAFIKFLGTDRENNENDSWNDSMLRTQSFTTEDIPKFSKGSSEKLKLAQSH